LPEQKTVSKVTSILPNTTATTPKVEVVKKRSTDEVVRHVFDQIKHDSICEIPRFVSRWFSHIF
jgi:hypothetical protein